MSLVWSQESYIKAYRFAALAHQGQKFSGTELPYLMHVSLVSMEVIAALSVEKVEDGNLAVQCALLHDTIEDTEVTYEQIAAEFGTPTAQGVLALTKDSTLPKEQRMRDSLNRIRIQPKAVWMVKLADRISNLQAPPFYWDQAKIKEYAEEASEIYEALKDGSSCLAARLLEKMEAYRHFENVTQRMD